MNRNLTTTLVVVAGLSGLAFAKAQGGSPSLEERVARLERNQTELREKNLALEYELLEARQDLERTFIYIEAQADAALDMARTLNESETLGFTWGINFDSREVLLAGWRQQLASLQKDLPKKPAPTAGNGTSKRRKR